MNIPPKPLRLSTQELNALQKTIDMAWDNLPWEVQQQTKPHNKEQRTIWAASRALAKIKDHLKGR